MSDCTHKSRAIGPWFERCLACQNWRVVGGKNWWSTPMPSAPADEDSGTAYEDFKGWLQERAS